MNTRTLPSRPSWWLSTRGLLTATVALAAVVLGLTAAVVVTEVGSESEPETMADREVAQWRDAAAANPGVAWAQTGLGLAQLDSGDEEGARASFEEALALDPDDWRAGFRLGVLLADADPERARGLLEHAADVAPVSERVAPYLALGDLLLEAGDVPAAQRAYENAVADAPHIFEARVGLARALEAAGDTRGALEQYRRAAQYDPDDRDVAAAIARLESGTPATSAPSEER